MFDHALSRVSGELLALGCVAASVMHAIPEIAAGLGIVWYGVLLYDRIRHGHGGPRE
jgi:hypothetical protein